MIYLRAIEPEDTDLIYRWENNTDNWLISNTLSPFSRNFILEYIKNHVHDIYTEKQLRLMICLNETQEAIGTVDLFDFDAYNKRVGLGILIAETEHRGKSYAKECLQVIEKYCFEVLQLKQIYCNILENNEISLNLFRSMKYKKAGTKKAWIFHKGEWLDEYFFQKVCSGI